VSSSCRARFAARVVVIVLAALGALTLVPQPPASSATFADAVLAEAARHAGKPYVYGATGPDSFDCSGFTGYVYGRLGVSLPRTSSQQYAALPKVASADKQPGDLVFTYDSSGIYHVGIYAGNNQMWAAPRTGDHVRLQTIWTSQHKVARPVSSRITQHWVAHGGASGFLGNPLTGEVGTPNGSGSYTHYQGGSIYASTRTAAQEVHGRIRDAWARLGWEQGGLGYPVTDERRTPDGRGRYNHFEGGSVYWTPQTDAKAVGGAIRWTWAEQGWERGSLGYPLTHESGTPDGRGRYNHFEGGSLYWTPQTGAQALGGPIRQTWAELGYERGALGYPVTDGTGTPDGRGRYNHFQGGSLYWTPETGARFIAGSIRGTWAALGWEKGALGYPTSHELGTPDGRSRYNDFERGAVYWTPSTGAREMRDVLLDRWRALGAGSSRLGYPISGERRAADGVGRSNAFQGGELHWSSETGAVMVAGPILDAWRAEGGETGALGYPVLDNHPVPGGEAVEFQGGTIVRDEANGSTTVVKPVGTGG
jgi:uncharacterized protein with LGFP repeats